jgi:hypothetical protein
MKRKHQPKRTLSLSNEQAEHPTRFKHLEGLAEDHKQLIKNIAKLFVATLMRLAKQKKRRK